MESLVEESLVETVTLSQARQLVQCIAHDQSLLLLSAPGVGKSDMVRQAAEGIGLKCRSLLGTQIAPEDVSGIPRIVGERSVFCPPRVLLPEDPEPFCLFLDELPAASPDIQKALYSILLERRLGEFPLPHGTWVVAAGNRAEDRALVRSISSALVNRVVILNVRVDHAEWMQWAQENGVRSEILAFIAFMPEALMRDVPPNPLPFSTPRSWAALSQALDLVDRPEGIDRELRRALAFGRVSPEDAAIFCAMAEEELTDVPTAAECFQNPQILPAGTTAQWFLIEQIRSAVANGEVVGVTPGQVDALLRSLPQELRFALLVDLVEAWGELGADRTLCDALKEVTGI